MSIKKLITSEKAFNSWNKLIKKKKIKIKNIKYTSIIKRQNCDFSLSTIDTKLIHKGKVFQRAIQLEGKSVVIIPILYFKNKIKTLLVSQFRATMAQETCEFASGKAEYQNLKKSAQAEILEELGIQISIKNIKKLNKKGIFLSANNYSEVFFFYFKKKIDSNMIKNFKNKIYGNLKQGEFIKLKILNIAELVKYYHCANIIVGNALLKKYEIL